jgi:phage baseplate assembly protein W
MNTRDYKDFDLNFGIHPITKDISKKTGPNAIVQALRSIILLNHYEKPFHPEIGSNIRKLLFEPMDPVSANILASEIKIAIMNFEPRVTVNNVFVKENYTENGFDVTVEFFMKNTEKPLVLSFFLERLR